MKWCEQVDKYISAFHQKAPASLCASYESIARQVASVALLLCCRQLKVMKADILVCCCAIIPNHTPGWRSWGTAAWQWEGAGWAVGARTSTNSISGSIHRSATPSLLDLSQVCTASARLRLGYSKITPVSWDRWNIRTQEQQNCDHPS